MQISRLWLCRIRISVVVRRPRPTMISTPRRVTLELESGTGQVNLESRTKSLGLRGANAGYPGFGGICRVRLVGRGIADGCRAWGVDNVHVMEFEPL